MGHARTFADPAELHNLPFVATIIVRGVDPHLSIVALPDHLDFVCARLQSRSLKSVNRSVSLVNPPHSCFRRACLGRK